MLPIIVVAALIIVLPLSIGYGTNSDLTIESVLSIDSSNSTDLLAVGKLSGDIELWNAANSTMESTFRQEQPAHVISWSKNDLFLATTSDDTLYIWEIEGLTLHLMIELSPSSNREIFWSGDELVAVFDVLSTERNLLILNINTGETTLQIESVDNYVNIGAFYRPQDFIALNNTFSDMAVANQNGEVTIYELNDFMPSILSDIANPLAWSNDETRLASADNSGNIFITADDTRQFEVSGDRFSEISWSNNDQYLSAISRDQQNLFILQPSSSESHQVEIPENEQVIRYTQWSTVSETLLIATNQVIEPDNSQTRNFIFLYDPLLREFTHTYEFDNPISTVSWYASGEAIAILIIDTVIIVDDLAPQK